VLKGGRKYLRRTEKRLAAYKFKFLRTKSPSIKRKILACTARIRIARRYMKSASVKKIVRRSTRRRCVRRN
jgi:hypothetical protein